jgi:hypothetical protein
MIKRLLGLAALLAAGFLFQAPAQAGLYVVVDIGNNGSAESWFQIDPVPSNPFGPVTVPLATTGPGGLTVSVTVNTFESAMQSFIGTISATVDSAGNPNITTGNVRIQALWTGIALPAGDPLLLASSITTPDASAAAPFNALVNASNSSYLDTVAVTPGSTPTPPGTAPVITVPGSGALVSQIPTGPSFPAGFIDAATGLRSRPGGTFDLLSDILINFDLTRADSLQISTQTSAAAVVPEASSLIAWGLCAGLGLIVAYRRKRVA